MSKSDVLLLTISIVSMMLLLYNYSTNNMLLSNLFLV